MHVYECLDSGNIRAAVFKLTQYPQTIYISCTQSHEENPLLCKAFITCSANARAQSLELLLCYNNCNCTLKCFAAAYWAPNPVNEVL